MQIIADLHTHTLSATHAFNTLDEMAAKYRLCVNVVTMYFCCSVSFPQTLQRNTGCLLSS